MLRAGRAGRFVPVTYIDKCRAPDLSDLNTPVMANYFLNRVFAGCGTSDRKADSFVILYILAVDKAVREYNAGGELLTEYAASENRMSLYIEALGRYETCINSAKRALRYVGRLSAHPGGPEVERSVRRLLDNHGKVVTPLRDAIEHMDDRVQKDQLADGEPHTLMVSHDSRYLEIADDRLALKQLAVLLRRLRELAVELASYRESADEPGS